MRVLVTGGAGFIGSHVVDHVIARGDTVCVLDHLSTGRIENIRHHLGRPGFTLVNDTILNAEVVNRLVESSDIVFHLAAAVGVRYIVDDPLSAISANVEGTEIVLRAAFRFWRKIVIASSSEVYGKSTRVPLGEDDDRVLGPTTVSRWSYSSSKAIDEHFAYAYAARGLPAVILRFFNVYGPRIHENGYGTVVARFIHQALNGRPLTVHGDGRQTRCFAYVEDTVRGAPDGAEAFQAGEGRTGFPARAHYRNCWWVHEPGSPFLYGSGIYGQHVFVHGPTETVAVKFSTWPSPLDQPAFDATAAAVLAIGRSL